MSSAICFSLDQSKILLSGKGLRQPHLKKQWAKNFSYGVSVTFFMDLYIIAKIAFTLSQTNPCFYGSAIHVF